MPSVDMADNSRLPVVLNSRPGQAIGRLTTGRFGSRLLVAATSKGSTYGNLHVWALPSSEDASPPPSGSVIRPAETVTSETPFLFTKVFPDGTLLATTADGTSTFYQTSFIENASTTSLGVSLTKVASNRPFELGLTEKLSFNCASPASDVPNEVAFALIDGRNTGRVAVLGVLSNESSNVEVIREFCYPAVLGNVATSCAVRCSSIAGSPLLVIGDLTGRLHFFDLRLATSNADGIGVPIFTKVGAVKPITAIGLHPFTSDSVMFGCEDGTISMLDLRLVSSETSSSAANQTGFAAHSLGVNAVAFNVAEPDQLFSAGSDGYLFEWSWSNQPTDVPSANPVFNVTGVSLNCIAVESSRHNAGPTVIAGSDLGDVFIVN